MSHVQVVLLGVVLLALSGVTEANGPYEPLKFSAQFRTLERFCLFLAAQQSPIVVYSYNSSTLPYCGANWSFVQNTTMTSSPVSTNGPVTSMAPLSPTAAPITFTPVTVAPATGSPTSAPQVSTLAPDTVAPDTVAPSTAAPDTQAPSTPGPVAHRSFLAMNATDNASTLVPVGNSSNGTNAPSFVNTTAAPAPSVAVVVVFSFVDTSSNVIEAENQLLSKSDQSWWLDPYAIVNPIVLLPYPPPPDPRPLPANITVTPSIESPDNYFFMLSFYGNYRFRGVAPSRALVPWLLNRPLMPSTWQQLGIILMNHVPSNDTAVVYQQVTDAAFAFPMRNLDRRGNQMYISSLTISELTSIMDSNCDLVAIPLMYTCWFVVNSSHPSSSFLLGALLNPDVRRYISSSMDGLASVRYINQSDYSKRLMSFDPVKVAAKAEYVRQKGLFAAGIVTVFILVIGSLMALWIWTGSGRTMAEGIHAHIQAVAATAQ